MRINLSESILAGLMGGALTGIAAGVVFGIPHGFEEGIGWFELLLPGVWIAVPISSALHIANPGIGNLMYRTLLFSISFAWYVGISFLVVKTYHFIRRF